MACNPVNRNVAIDRFGACGSKVEDVNEVDSDTDVIYEVNVTIGNPELGDVQGGRSDADLATLAL